MAGATMDAERLRRSSDADALVYLSDVTYTYDGEAAPVLRDISLTVKPGDFVLILGPSGCGKHSPGCGPI